MTLIHSTEMLDTATKSTHQTTRLEQITKKITNKGQTTVASMLPSTASIRGTNLAWVDSHPDYRRHRPLYEIAAQYKMKTSVEFQMLHAQTPFTFNVHATQPPGHVAFLDIVLHLYRYTDGPHPTVRVTVAKRANHQASVAHLSLTHQEIADNEVAPDIPADMEVRVHCLKLIIMTYRCLLDFG